MTPGSIFFDKKFVFHDGEDGKKILISLGTSSGVTLVAKTTSQGHRYGCNFGCQHKDRFPNFHLVQNCCVLSKPTWVCLSEFYEFNDAQLLKKKFGGDIEHIGDLSNEITKSLLECAVASEDITELQEKIVAQGIASMGSAAA